MPSKIKDTLSKIDSPCNTVNGHNDKEESKEKCEDIKEIASEKEEPKEKCEDNKEMASVSEKNISKPNNASYIEEDIDEGIGNSTQSVVEDMVTTTESDNKDNENFKDQEFVFIHDTGFTVKIVAPGVDPFDIQVIFIL